MNIEVQLFLGIPVDSQLSKRLDLVDSGLLEEYIDKGDDKSLQFATYQGQRYIGKPVGSFTDLPKLELLEMNIWSLLKKIVPAQKITEKTLELFPLYVKKES